MTSIVSIYTPHHYSYGTAKLREDGTPHVWVTLSYEPGCTLHVGADQVRPMIEGLQKGLAEAEAQLAKLQAPKEEVANG